VIIVAKTILITGAGGRMGRYIARILVEKGHTVHSLVQNKEQALALPSGTVPYLGDINNQKVVGAACHDVDVVMHFAAIVSEYKATTEQILNTNVVGTRTLLDACKDNGVKKFIFPSTVDVYGRWRKERLNEESELKPTDKYGYSKMLAENLIREESESMGYVIMRLAAAYGPGFEGSFFKLIALIKDGKAYLIGDGDNYLSIVHVSDIAQGFMLAMDKNASNGKTFNISDGQDHTQKQLFSLTAELLHVQKPNKQISNIIMNLMAKTKDIDSDEMRFLTSNRRIDISKALKELGYKPKVGIEKGTMELIEAFNEKQRYSEKRLIA
jgi:nucleoside-diphosphate-sugar epimerase